MSCLNVALQLQIHKVESQCQATIRSIDQQEISRYPFNFGLTQSSLTTLIT